MYKSLLLVVALLFLTVPLTAQVTDKSYDPIPEPPYSYAKEEMDSIYKLAEGYYYRGNYEKVIDKVPALLEYADKIKASRAETRLRGILGLAFVKLNDVDRADEMLREALTDAMKRKDTFDILSNNINLANTHFNSDSEKSIYYFENAIDYLGNFDISILAFVIIHIDLAELYMTRNEPGIAQNYLDLARPKLFLPELASRKTEYLASSDYIQAGIYLSQGLNFRAIESANQSLALGEGTNIEEKYFIGNYKILIDAYDLTGQYEQLNEARKPYDSLRDSRYEQERIEQEQIARFRFNTDKYQQELRESQLESELANQKADLSRIIIIAFTFVALILIGLLVTLLRNRRKRNKLLIDLRIKNAQYLEAKETSEKLAQKNTKFLSTISHELRTPLYGIIGLSSVFLKNPKLQEFTTDFNSLKFSADYLLALVNDVLNINKYESKKGQELKEEYFDIKILANGILKTFQFLNEKNNNKISLEIDKNVPAVLYGDTTKISQVIMNLLSNASKFTQDGFIYFTIDHRNTIDGVVELFFKVEDTGRGIKEENQKEIFEEFTQVPNSLSEGGTGLGLPIVNKLLTILGSELQLESIYGKGTTFSFSLSLKKGSISNLQAFVAEANTGVLKNKKLLIVDDNKINQIVTQKVLDLYGMNHDTVNNGQEAVDIVQQNTYNYILMDINMPVMNGIDASIAIRELGFKTPIIALTAADDLNLEEDVYRHGIDDILVKPYYTEELLNLLLSHIN